MHDVLRDLIGAAAKAGALGEGRALALLDAVNGNDPAVAEAASRTPEFTPEHQAQLDALQAHREAAQGAQGQQAAPPANRFGQQQAAPAGRFGGLAAVPARQPTSMGWTGGPGPAAQTGRSLFDR